MSSTEALIAEHAKCSHVFPQKMNFHLPINIESKILPAYLCIAQLFKSELPCVQIIIESFHRSWGST